MLGDLEDLIEQRITELSQHIPRLSVGSYGGELGDAGLLPGLLKRSPAVLITTPKASFKKRSMQRYGVVLTLRLIIATRQARSEREGRRGTAQEVGSYELWQACMQQLVDWQPWPGRAALVPTEYSNLVNGVFQRDSLSVLGQSFSIELDWAKPEQALPDLLGIDMAYHVPADNPEPAAYDTINLEDV